MLRHRRTHFIELDLGSNVWPTPSFTTDQDTAALHGLLVQVRAQRVFFSVSVCVCVGVGVGVDVDVRVGLYMFVSPGRVEMRRFCVRAYHWVKIIIRRRSRRASRKGHRSSWRRRRDE
jgi:hypothetical protein